VSPTPPSLSLNVNGRPTRSTRASRVTISGTVSGAVTVQIVQGSAKLLPGNVTSIPVNPNGSRWRLRTGNLDLGRNTLKLLATAADGQVTLLTVAVIKR
jgi:hypothetical protein